MLTLFEQDSTKNVDIFIHDFQCDKCHIIEMVDGSPNSYKALCLQSAFSAETDQCNLQSSNRDKGKAITLDNLAFVLY